MPRLFSVFELKDKFSSTAEKVIKSTNRVEASVTKTSATVDRANSALERTGGSATKASTATSKVTTSVDKMNRSLEKTDDIAEKAGVSIKRLIGAAGGLAVLKKVADISDTYSNAGARLNLINDGQQTGPEFQQKVYASAQRSRTTYDSTANAIASLGLNAKNAFSGNDEMIAFMEAINKQFVIAGTGAAAAQGAMTQLTQAMGAGALRGEELNSILDAAPGIARNIEKYMGWAEGSIKSYAEKGMISAEIVKNAQLKYMDEINEQYNSMPWTWSQIMTVTMEKMLWASQPLLKIVSALANNWDIVAPILIGVGGAVGVYMVATHGAAAATAVWTAAQAAFNAVMGLNPVALVAMGVILLVAALYAGVAAYNNITGASVSATGMMVGGINVVIQFFWNLLQVVMNVALGIGGAAGAVANNIQVAFKNSIINVQASFYGLLSTALTVISKIADQLSKLPFVEFDASGISGAADAYVAKEAALKKSKGTYESIGDAFSKGYGTFDAFKDGWAGDAYNKGYEKGAGAAEKVSDFFAGGSTGFDSSQFATAGSPATIKGTGKGGAVKIENEEDTEWMMELAKRDYVARIAQNTLAPNIKVEFTGPITKEADVDGVAAHMAEQLKEIIATAPEGVYP